MPSSPPPCCYSASRSPQKLLYTISTRSLPASPVSTSSPSLSPNSYPSSISKSPSSPNPGYIPITIPANVDTHTTPIRPLNNKRFSTATSTSRLSTQSSRTMSDFWTGVVNTTAFSYLKLSIAASTGLAAVLSTALYFKQNDLIYPRHFPPEARTELFTPQKFKMQNWETVDLETPDGEFLKSFYLRGSGVQKRDVTILLLHGNAGNVGHRIPIGKVFAEQIGCNVFMLGYRGYGLSTGKPDEKGLKLDAETALKWIYNHDELKKTKVVIYGQSLGGAVGIQMAARHQDRLSGLILENTFTSMRAVIPNVFPPAKYITRLCHQVWPSEDTIPKVSDIPILFLSGLQDELVPPEHMKKLHGVSTAKVKIWKELPNGTHNDSVLEPGYFEYINDFVTDEVMRHKKAQ